MKHSRPCRIGDVVCNARLCDECDGYLTEQDKKAVLEWSYQEKKWQSWRRVAQINEELREGEKRDGNT